MHALLAPDTKVRDFVVYSLSDPDSGEVRYVGKTDNLQRRYTVHLYEARHGQPAYKNRWLAGLLREGKLPKIEVIDSGISAQDIDEAEKFWISVYRGWGVRLTNLTDGGGGICNPSPELRAKMSASAKARGTSAAQLAGLDKGRRKRKGELNANARLTEAIVLAIREERAAGATLDALAKKYGVSPGTVQPIVNGLTWVHVGGPIQKPKRHLTDNEVKDLRRRACNGENTRSLANAFGLSRVQVNNLISGRSRPETPDS